MQPPVRDELEGLLWHARQGDQRAQDLLFRKIWPLLLRIVRARRARLGGRVGWDSTGDIAQGVALRLLRDLPRHTWQGGTAFQAWIAAMARAEVVDRRRYHGAARRDTRKNVPVDEAAHELRHLLTSRTSTESKVARLLELRRVEKLLARLSDGQAGAILLRKTLGYEHGEVAAVLGCTTEAARKLYTRGIARLSGLLLEDEARRRKSARCKDASSG